MKANPVHRRVNFSAALPKPLFPDAGATTSAAFPLVEYALAATLDSGQAFRWRRQPDASWEGVIGSRWVRLRYEPEQLLAETAAPVADWRWLLDYLQLDADLAQIRATFPDDPPMRAALAHCRGLRLLRQEPWECLASFILSSTKQIVQIRQIVEALCIRFGQPLAVPPGHAPVHAFPTAARLAACSEAELRGCKMGFRAPYLRATAQRVHAGDVALATLGDRTCAAGRGELMELPGVGRKIADCVLLFAYGFQKRSRWMCGCARRCSNFIFPAGARPRRDWSDSPRRISVRTPATPSSICFTTCARLRRKRFRPRG